MTIVKSKADIPANPWSVTCQLENMESHKNIVQHSKSAVHSKVSKTSDGMGARDAKRKTCSHSQVPQKLMKKRGVYVEKTRSRPDAHVSPLIQAYMAHTGRGHHHRRSPVPKRRNTFISNVLSALSKSTTSTQYPPIADTAAKAHLLSMALKRNASVSTSDAAHDTGAKAKDLVEKIVHKHKKHRIGGVHKRRSPRPLVVLKSKKSIVQSPSNVSQVEPSRTNVEKTKHKKRQSVKNELQRSLYKEHESRIANAVLEGQEYKTIRRKLVDDQPVTLVSTIDQPEDKGLYKLFMNLLETTFSVYNVDTSVRSQAYGVQRSLDERRQENTQSYIVTDHSYNTPYQCYPTKLWPKTTAPKPKLKPCLKSAVTRDFPAQYYRTVRPQLPEPKGPPEQVKRVKKHKKKYKETLLGLLKHELDMETYRSPQPTNLYQALRVIARNKSRRKRLTRFGDESRRPDLSTSPDRFTLRRKTALAPKKAPLTKRRSFLKFREQLQGNGSDESEDDLIVPQIEEVSSYRTLEVLAYDGEGLVSKRRVYSDDSLLWDSVHRLV